MSRTTDRATLSDSTRLFLLEQDMDQVTADVKGLWSKLDSIQKTLIAVLITLITATVSICGTIVLVVR